MEATHELEDGGGRELSYVRLSRARGRATAYTVADDIEMAAEDLRRAWSNETRPRWAVDRAPSDPRTPGFGLDSRDVTPGGAPGPPGRRARGPHRPHPPKPETDWRIQSHLNRLRNAMHDLDTDNCLRRLRRHPSGPRPLRPEGRPLRREPHSHEGSWHRRPGFARAARDAATPAALTLEAAYRAWLPPSEPASPPSWPTPKPLSPHVTPRTLPITVSCASSTPRSPGGSNGSNGR